MRRIKTFILVLLGGFIGGGFCAVASAAAESSRAPGAMISSARVPFVANEGQVANPAVKYYARTFGGTVYALSDGKIVYSLPKYEAGKTAGSVVITESLRGAFHDQPVGAGKSPVSVSSFIGNRPEKWKSNLPVFDRLDFGEVYEGISLLLSAHGNNVEKIFVLSPGADPRDIAFGFEGASGIEIMPDGKLELQTALGKVYFTRPVAWQIDAPPAVGKTLNTQRPTLNLEREGPSWMFSALADPLLRKSLTLNVESCRSAAGTTPVDVAYALDEDGTVRFELSSYDPNKILVIDPLLASTFIGGGGADAVQAMVVDSQTNIYVAGYTASSDFPVNSPYSSINAGGQDAFVSKFDANLGSLSASTYIGGSSNDQATAIGIDASSRIWIAGYTESTNFPCGDSSMNSNYNGNGDAFVVVLTNILSTLVRATYIGGSNTDYASAIAMDNLSYRQYVAGYTESGNFPVTNSTGYKTNYNGARDAFIMIFSNDVNRAGYKTGIFLGGTNADEAAGMVLSPGTSSTNFVYVVGSTTSTNFPVTNGYQMTNGGSYDAFVSKLSVLLTNLPAATFLGGTDDDKAYAVGLDVSNKLYVAGYTRSSNFPVTNGYQMANGGSYDVFVTCLTNNLTNLYASTYVGGTGNDAAKCLVVDSSSTTNLEYVYLAGYTASSDFPATRAAYARFNNGGEDAFTLRFNGSLTNLYASTYLGGGSNDQALAIALSSDTNFLYVAGITFSSDFPSSDTAYQNVFGGASDGFVTKFPASLAYGTVKWQKSLYDSRCSSPVLTWDGMVVVGNRTSLYAFTRSGVERWQVVTTSAVAIQADVLNGLGSPAVGTNDVVYINTSNGTVYAITSAGAITNLFETTPQNRWSSIAIGNENQIIFSQGLAFYSVGANGARQWTNTLTGDNYSSPAIGSNETTYAGQSDAPAKLYAVNNSDGITSNTWTMVGAMYSSPALDTNGTIYTASSNKLYAFSPDGLTTQTWTVAGVAQIYSSPAIGTNGVIYIGGGSNLYAFNTNGTTAKIWGADGEVKSSPAIAADGSIIVGVTTGTTGIIYSFNPDGTTNWVYGTDYEIHFQSPLIDSEGTVYISDIFRIYAIYGSAPPADSAWPMFRRDALRTGNQGLNVADFLKPTGLTVSKYGAFANIHVGWNASSNALNYELWRNTNYSTVGATRISRLTLTNYNDSSADPGKIYYYWVKVKTPVALSAFSASDFGGIPPLPPENVTASDGVPTNYVQVTWQASSNATTYTVWRSLSDSTNTATPLGSPTPASATNYNDTSVPPGQGYYYWIKAANAQAGESGFSSSHYGGIPCWAPSGLSASQGAYMQRVDLSWNLSTNAGSYIVYRNTENDSATAGIITNTSGSPMSDYSGTPMLRYYYWIRATNAFGLSGFSASALGWRLLAYPQSVSASSGAYPNMIRVSWIAGSTDATAHVIFRSENSASSSAVKQSEVIYNDLTATNYDDTAITRGASYYYWVAAKNNYGSSIWVAASSPGGTIPVTPFDLSASDGTYSNMVQVAWNSSAGATSYAVYRHTTFDSSFATQIGSSSTNYYDDSSALNGVLYYYWVKAGNAFGFSDLSTFNSGWRGMAPPDSITATDGSSTSLVSVTWSAAPNAAVYELWRGTSSNVASANKLVNNLSAVSSPSYSDRSAVPGTIYYYWVKAKRGNYSSVFSSSDFGYMAIGLLDLRVTDFVFVPTVFGPLAHPSAVSFNIANLSANNMIGPNNTVQYDFYLTRTTNFGASDLYWVGSTNSAVTLNAGASARVALSQAMREVISIPDWATGSYYVFVFANHCLPSTWLDPNLTDNAARRIGDSISIASATAFQPVWNDFDGDGKSDLVLYSGGPSAGSTSSPQAGQGGWKAWLSASDYAQVDLSGFGGAGYRAVPRDYDCDGKFDLAVYNEQAGGWLICLSASGYQTASASGWGGAGQYAVPADYDGDGLVDPAVYNEATGGWRGWMSGSGYAEVNSSGMGGSGWRPAPADYDGDGHADPAVYQQAGGWRVWLSGSGYQEAYVINWGGSGWRPVPADYDADGKVDPAVYNEATGGWRVWPSGGGYQENSVSGCGGSGQTAVPGDYDGDGRVDLVVYWESMGIWRLWLSSDGYTELDILVPGGEGFHAITSDEM